MGERIAEINVVPYVDVLLVVLTIFSVAAPLLAHEVLVKLPKGGVEVLPNNALPLTVTIDDAGAVYLDRGRQRDRSVDEFTLSREASAILRQRPTTPVILRASEKAEYGNVIRVMALLKSAGAPSIGLMTRNAGH
ncbi:MAG: ExbD/TolR family protein [Rhizobiales bacterium]|nr:ExbD/TolR family protein [Hyphomicrobiales bacterium]